MTTSDPASIHPAFNAITNGDLLDRQHEIHAVSRFDQVKRAIKSVKAELSAQGEASDHLDVGDETVAILVLAAMADEALRRLDMSEVRRGAGK